MNFYNETKPNLLAVAFSTAHSVYKGKINLDFDLLSDYYKKILIPLVMHGTSCVPFEMISKAVKIGCAKINVGTRLLIAMTNAMRLSFSDDPKAYDIRKLFFPVINAIKNRAIEYINVCK